MNSKLSERFFEVEHVVEEEVGEDRVRRVLEDGEGVVADQAAAVFGPPVADRRVTEVPFGM